jgi:serine/threonine protein kinase
MRLCRQCRAPLPAETPTWFCHQCEVDPDRLPPVGPSPPPSPADIAQFFPGLQVLELIGSGGMGMIYKARQPQLDRMVALKILSPELSRDPAFAERFSREAQALARLHHSNIVSIFDFGQAGGFYYLLMEYVDGFTLRALIQQQRLAPAEAQRLVVEICHALQFAHEEGIVHRDIKPSNILIDKKGRVKIADFGLAKLAGKDGNFLWAGHTAMIMGTPHYMAPEQVESPGQVDHRADIYALGVVFYELLTGELPLGRFLAPSKKARIDPRLDRVVLRALEKEPRRRFQHVGEVRTAVEAVTGGIHASHAGGRPLLQARWKLLGQFALMSASAFLAIILYLAFTAFWPAAQSGRIPPGAMEAFSANPEGVNLGRRMTSSLHLSGEQTNTVNRILRRYQRQFSTLERLNTDRYKDAAGHVHVTIHAFPEEMDNLLKRMWSELALVLSPSQLDTARTSHLERLFPHTGKVPVYVEIWQENGEYHYIEGQHDSATTPVSPMPQRYKQLLPDQ